MNLTTLRNAFESASYVFDDDLLTTIYVSIKLGKPILIEGAAGVGKTEVAKVLASAFDVDLTRLQCYAGLDESKALYEWNYQKQLLSIQLDSNQNTQDCRQGNKLEGLFNKDFLLERPLLKVINSDREEVLLIDEIDKADEEFEAFLLELLSDFQVSIPELGTIKAKNKPVIVLTSNNTRQLSDALRRRCSYLFIDYPTIENEIKIIDSKSNTVPEKLAANVESAVEYLRNNEKIFKKPSVAATLDWVFALMALDKKKLDEDGVKRTLGFVLKNQEDILELWEDGGFGKFFAEQHS